MLCRTVCVAFVALVALSTIAQAISVDRTLGRVHRRRETSFEAAGTLKCPQPSAPGKEDAAAITLADKFANFPLAGNAVVQWDAAGTKWTYKAGFRSIHDGSDWATKEMKPADFCKMDPGFCKGEKPAFCTIQAVIDANLCCPLMARPAVGGASCTASGIPRAWMPQVVTGADGMITSYGKLAAWAKTKSAPLNTLAFSGSIGLTLNGKKKVDGTDGDYTGGQKELEVSKMSPSQDEILLGNSFNKLCTKKGTRTPVPYFAPLMSSDGYIIDGHHRWSQIKACKYLDATTACPADKPDKLNIVQANLKIEEFLVPVIKEAIAGWGGAPVPDTKKTCCDGTTEFIAPPAFVEVDAHFGRATSQHKTLAEAAVAFAVQTRARMAEAGLELKGGLDAHVQMFHAFHAERLGWSA